MHVHLILQQYWCLKSQNFISRKVYRNVSFNLVLNVVI